MSSRVSTGMTMQAAQRLELVLSPLMIQSMEFLQMPVMQLEQRLRQEQLDNPALEIAELEEGGDDGEGGVPGEAVPDEEAGEGGEAGTGEAEPAGNVEPDDDDAPGLGRMDEVDFDWEDYDERSPARAGGPDAEEAFDPTANLQARPPSLLEHLLAQLAEAPIPDRLRRLAAGMAERLDANGWLTAPLAETTPEGEAPASRRELEAALAELQKLSPDGVGARGLSECLILQLRNRPEAGPLAEAVVRGHLADLAANRLPAIARKLKCGLDEVKRAVALIRTLNPRPAAGFSEAPVRDVRPELVVEGDAESGYRVRTFSGEEPRISELFSAAFDNSRRGRLLRERLAADPERGPALRQFQEQLRRNGLTKSFREKFNRAQWLVKAVAQRERTLLAVAGEIVRAQTAYLAGRRDAPAPLFMQNVAEAVGCDISTVSRAVRDKYADTPLGIRPLKHFFARGGAGAGEGPPGEEARSSSASLLLRIRDLIDGEDRRRPLRDNEIMARLAAEGLAVKRRTVVNYRERLGFPSHSQRREH